MNRKRADTMMSGAAVSIGLMDAGAKEASFTNEKEDGNGYDEDDNSRVPSFAAPVKSP